MPESANDDVTRAARSGGLDRRQLLKASAWAAPALVLATAAPAAAASPVEGTVSLGDVRVLPEGGVPEGATFEIRPQIVASAGTAPAGETVVTLTLSQPIEVSAPTLEDATSGGAVWAMRSYVDQQGDRITVLTTSSIPSGAASTPRVIFVRPSGSAPGTHSAILAVDGSGSDVLRFSFSYT